MKIALDIGHARLTGATGNGLQEHELAADLARLLARYLNPPHAVEVIDFPNLSNSADLAATVRAVNAGKFDLCLSLHFDSSKNTAARGAHVIYTSPKGKTVAEVIASHICPILPGRAEKTVHRDGLYVLDETDCPAVLIEGGFLTNDGDAAFLKNELYRLARAIAVALKNFSFE